MEAWEEALDIDDADLPSLLRPCNRQSNSSSPLLQYQSNPTQTLVDSSQSQLSHSSVTVTTTSPRLIPGPAGAVQAALHRRMSQNQNPSSRSGDEDVIPTQEYLRRVVENGDEHDDDFTRNSWLCAVDFIRRNGIGDGLALGTPLSSIKDCFNTCRVPQIVAMIKSCTTNGLGDLIITLKDPTGTMGASIHRKVLAEGEFGRDISVGAVLILEKVVVFSPSRSAHYLNITLSNVIKVISKDCGPPSNQSYSADAFQRAASESVRSPGMPEKETPLMPGRSDSIIDKVRFTADKKSTAQNDLHMNESNATPASSSICYNHGNQNTDFESQPSLVTQDLAQRKGIAELGGREDNNSNGLGVQVDEQPNAWKQADDGDLFGSTKCSGRTDNLVEFPAYQDCESGMKKGAMKQGESLISRTSLPQWTDEQLDELFAVYSDDGDSVL